MLLDITVEIRGQTAGVKVKESSGYGILDEAAVEAVRGWTFEPARLNDEAVRSQVEVPIRFYLTRPSLR